MSQRTLRDEVLQLPRGTSPACWGDLGQPRSVARCRPCARLAPWGPGQTARRLCGTGDAHVGTGSGACAA